MLLPLVPGYEVGALFGMPVCNVFAPSYTEDAAINGKVTTSIAKWNKILKFWDLSMNNLLRLAFKTFGKIRSLTVKLSMLTFFCRFR